MVHRVLYHLAHLVEIPFIAASMLAAWLWLGSWLAVPVGFVVGRVLYYPVKLGIAASTIGPEWGKCWGEMILLDVKKVSFGGNTMGAVIFLFPLGMITLVAGTIIHSEFIMWMGFIVSVGIGNLYMFATIPAVVLFLGRSSHETNDFLNRLRLRLFPLRMTSLLDARGSVERLSFRGRLGDYDNVRVNKTDDWLEVVTRLATITPVLILDCRQDSDAVVDEIELLKQPAFATKTLAIVGDDGRALHVTR